MAMTFGKSNRSIAFNPTSAFPLDARSYFESYEAAVEAAGRAAWAGDTNTEYYFGQTIAVVENNRAALYIIQPNKTLDPFVADNGTQIIVDANQFAFDDKGQLILKGSNTASPGSLASINENGLLHWVAPIDSYTKAEVDTLIANSAHLKRRIVSSVEDIELYISEHNDADLYIFMVPVNLDGVDDKYNEYMVITVDGTSTIEKVGSWEINLDGYAKSEDIEEALKQKVNVEPGSRLITEDEIKKLLNIDEGAEANFISSVSNDFVVTNDGTLQLQNLNIEKIIGLQTALDKKVSAIDNWTLLSPRDQTKLEKITEDGEFTGTIDVKNVIDLDEWLTDHANSVKGLSEENFTSTLQKKLQDSLLISSVDSAELKVENSQLSIAALNVSKITGLDEVLARKAEDIKQAIQTDISGDINEALKAYVTLVDHEKDIQDLRNALTWKEIQ